MVDDRRMLMNKIAYMIQTTRTGEMKKNIPKRIFDIVISFLLLILLGPLLIFFALLILLLSGRPILFKQIRTGKDNKPFTIWKFRTMEVNWSSVHHQYEWQSGVPDDFSFEKPKYQRVTFIGKIYRKLSIDELPQLINILRGEMSLVGPRPEIPEITHLYSSYQVKRLKAKPGLTGYAQVNGRSGITHGQKIEYDLFYIRNYSFLLDMKVILKTIGLVLRGKGAW